MNKRDVVEAIVARLNPILGPAGFRHVKREEGFVRKLPGMRQALAIALKDYRPAYNLSFALSTRIEAVDAVLGRFGASGLIQTQLEFFGLESAMPWGPFWFADSGAELDEGFLATGRAQGFWIERPEARDTALRRAGELVKTKLLPGFERFKDLESINRALNEEQDRRRGSFLSRVFSRSRAEGLEPVQASRRRFDSRRHSDRLLTALAVARLAGDERFERLADNYRNEAGLFGGEQLQKYEELVAFLRRGQTD